MMIKKEEKQIVEDDDTHTQSREYILQNGAKQILLRCAYRLKKNNTAPICH